MYTPGYGITIPPMVSIFTKGIGWITEDYVATSPASATWESANRAVFCPIILLSSGTIRRVWWANGATTTGGATIEVGVYADSGYGPGAKIISGSATQGTASEVQFVDVTDTVLAPGLYWIAIVSTSATNTTILRSTVTAAYDAATRFQQNTASPLPATATPAESNNTNIYLCGFATTASP